MVFLSEQVHLDIAHHARELYARPKDLRIHPWLGPSMCEPILPILSPRPHPCQSVRLSQARQAGKSSTPAVFSLAKHLYACGHGWG
jgi:hypothetical protein